jgi:hypothetical protein
MNPSKDGEGFVDKMFSRVIWYNLDTEGIRRDRIEEWTEGGVFDGRHSKRH